MPVAMPSTPMTAASAPWTAPRIRGKRPRREAEEGERDEGADDVVAGRGARLRLHDVVVEDVQRDQREADPEEDGGARPAPTPPRLRRGGGGAGHGDGHHYS